MSDVLPFQPPAAPPPAGASVTVAQVVAQYLAAQRHEVKPRTHAAAATIGALLGAAFGGRLADSLRPSEVRAWIHANPNWQAASTRRRVHATVKAMFAWADEDRLLPANPIRGKTLPPGERREMTDDAGFAELVRLADEDFRRYAQFLRWTGARPQDGRSVRWEWRQQNCRDLIVIPAGQHKTGSRKGKDKLLWLSPAAAELLERIDRDRADALFPAAGPILLNGRRPWSESAVGRRMAGLRGRGLPAAVSLHGLRHAFTTSALAHGGSLAIVQQVLDHEDASTTQGYAHLDAASRRLFLDAAELGARPLTPPPAQAD